MEFDEDIFYDFTETGQKGVLLYCYYVWKLEFLHVVLDSAIINGISVCLYFYNSSDCYVSPLRISKTIGEIARVTSMAIIHSRLSSSQQGMLPLHPQQTQSPSSSQSII